MQADVKQEVVRYFDRSIRFYRVFWHGSAGALHFGIRGPDTRSHADELLNTNRVLSNEAGVEDGLRVLDAGCGVGGSALWLARNHDVEVEGVTLSPVQSRQAALDAEAAGLSDRVQFHVQDYCATAFADQSFDVVWALESSCYAEDKAAFLREAFRLLKPGGRLVIGDGFRARKPRNRLEARLYTWFLSGLILPELPKVAQLSAVMEEVGFESVVAKSHLRAVMPSAARLFRRCFFTFPLAALAYAVGRIPRALLENSKAGISVYPLARMQVVDYATVCAVRPHEPA